MEPDHKDLEPGISVAQPTDSNWQAIGFAGRAREYFGIWITNLTLSLITVGIYSAWAKVRRLTYFHNRTIIAGYGFGYHATGIQLLKGRLIAFVIIVLANFLVLAYPLAGFAIALLFVAVAPWLVNKSLKFGARMTSFRNVRFDWHGTYWKSLLFFIIGPFIGLASLGTLLPLMSRYYYRYFATGHSYGITRFSAEPGTAGFYMAFLLGALLPAILVGILVAGGFILYLDPYILLTEYGEPVLWDLYLDAELLLFLLPMFIQGSVLGLLFFLAFVYGPLCRNLLVNTLALGDVARFRSAISPPRFVWISLSNLFLTIVSLGLMLPWCQVRMYRYLCNCTSVSLVGDIDDFIDSERQKRSAFGEEFAEFEGLDISI